MWRLPWAVMIVVMATSFLSPPHVPLRSSTARSALLHAQMDASRAAPTVPDFEFPEQPTHSLAVYDTMLKVKPYPNTCPFGDADFAADVQAEELMPSPSSADAAALQKLYSSWLPGASSVLEIVCDGRSRVRARRQCAVTQLHLTSQSYKAGRRNSRKASPRPHPHPRPHPYPHPHPHPHPRPRPRPRPRRNPHSDPHTNPDPRPEPHTNPHPHPHPTPNPNPNPNPNPHQVWAAAGMSSTSRGDGTGSTT